jgi:long-chain acyl-CoA synthetase
MPRCWWPRGAAERICAKILPTEQTTRTTHAMASSEFKTLCELFLTAIDEHQKPDAFLVKTEGQYRGTSSQQALLQAAGLAAALERLGLARGDRMAILGENRLEWALSDYAALGLGAIVVPIFPTLLEPDLEFILRDSEAKGIVVSTETQLRKVQKVRGRLPALRFVLTMDPVEVPSADAQHWARVVREELSRATDCVASFRARALEARPEDAATLLYTSGTLGEPKGVILTHNNLVSNVRACKPLFALGPQDVAFSFLPLSHVFERMLDYFCFGQGVSIAYAESMEAMPRNLLEVRPTLMAVVPRILERIHDRVMDAVGQASAPKQKLFWWALDIGRQCLPYYCENRRLPLSVRIRRAVASALVYSKVRARMGGRLRFMISGAAALGRDLTEFFHAVGLPVYEGYGLTETSPVIAVNYPGHVKLETVGPVISGVEVKLGKEITTENQGAGREILVRGPNVTPGYYHNEEANRAAFEEGWFHTGDLGELDGDGYLRITGRKKNLFKTSGGKYVSPDKVESLFQGHPYVAQIVVLGEARRFVAALIVPHFERLERYARETGIAARNPEELVAHPAIQAFFQGQADEAGRWLAPHERIRRVTVLAREFSIDAGELTPTQKVRRHVVSERYHEIIERMYRSPALQASPAAGEHPEGSASRRQGNSSRAG